MNPYAISPLICAAFALSLGLFVLFKNPKSALNRSFFVLAYEAFHWEMTWFISFYLASDAQLNICAKIAFSSVLFLPFSYYHFVIHSLGQFAENKKNVLAFYLLALFWLIILWSSDLLIAGHRKFNWGAYPKNGILLPLYILSLSIGILFIAFALIRRIKDKSFSPIVRNEAKFIFLAYSLFTCASVEFLIDLGLVGFYPIGVYFILASFSVIAYAIVKYNLMGIEALSKELLAKIASSLLIGSSGLIFVLSLLKLLDLKSQILSSLISMVVMAAILPLIIKTSTFISQTIRPRPDFQAMLKSYTEIDIMAQYTSKGLAELVVQKISDSLRPTVCSLMLLDETTGLYNVVASSGKDEEIKTIAFKQTNHLISALKNTHNIRLIVKDELSKIFPREQADLIRRDLEILKSQICLPLILQGKLFGLLNLGPKTSGQLYTPEEIGFIFIFLTQSAFMMRFLDGIHKIHELETRAEKLAGMTNLLDGFHHEFRNQINTVDFFMKNYDDPALQEAMKNYRPLASEAFEAILMILDSVQNYRETADVKEITLADLNQTINSALTELKDKFASIDVNMTINIPAALPKIETYPSFKYLFYNLLTNCYYALGQSVIKTRLLDIKAYQTKDPAGPIEVVVTDTGGDITKVMKPAAPSTGGEYFPERSRIGGINYFLVKHIVEDHNGQLIITTNPPPAPDELPGTIFTIRLPLTQPKE